jgi:hypothetical protein
MKAIHPRIIVAIVATLVGVSSLRPQATNLQLQPKKTWEFKAQQGIITVDLFVNSYPGHPEVPSLDMLYSNDARPSLAEEVGFVREVLHQLPGLGVDPHSISVISMRGFAEPEVKERLAIAALHSKAWQSQTTVIGGAERVVQDLLNSLGAYDPFNAAFEEYGLRVKVGGVEKVSSAKCLDLKISDPFCSIHHNPHLPTGANFSLVLEKKV